MILILMQYNDTELEAMTGCLGHLHVLHHDKKHELKKYLTNFYLNLDQALEFRQFICGYVT